MARSYCLNLCYLIVNWTPRNKLQWNLSQTTKLFINENALENVVCEMAVIFIRGRWVDVYFRMDGFHKYILFFNSVLQHEVIYVEKIYITDSTDHRGKPLLEKLKIMCPVLWSSIVRSRCGMQTEYWNSIIILSVCTVAVVFVIL